MAPEREHANDLAVAYQWHAERAAVLLDGLAPVAVFSVPGYVEDVDRTPFDGSAAGDGAAVQCGALLTHILDVAWGRTVRREHAHHLTLATEHHACLRIAQAHRVLQQRIEHRLRIRRRAGDDLEDLGCRSLPLERIRRLVKEAHILDGDNRLVGEGF